MTGNIRLSPTAEANANLPHARLLCMRRNSSNGGDIRLRQIAYGGERRRKVALPLSSKEKSHRTGRQQRRRELRALQPARVGGSRGEGRGLRRPVRGVRAELCRRQAGKSTEVVVFEPALCAAVSSRTRRSSTTSETPWPSRRTTTVVEVDSAPANIESAATVPVVPPEAGGGEERQWRRGAEDTRRPRINKLISSGVELTSRPRNRARPPAGRRRRRRRPRGGGTRGAAAGTRASDNTEGKSSAADEVVVVLAADARGEVEARRNRRRRRGGSGGAGAAGRC
jgi:hypothetical protein